MATKKKTAKKNTKKPSKKQSVIKAAPKKTIADRNFDRLIDVWFSTTMEPFFNGKIEMDEVLHRISTIFRCTASDLEMAPEEADRILQIYSGQYAEDCGIEPYVCEDCQAEHQHQQEEDKGKLLN